MGCVGNRGPRNEEALNDKDNKGQVNGAPPTQPNAQAEPEEPALRKSESRLRSAAGESPKKLTPSQVEEKRENMRKHLEEGNPQPPTVVMPRMQPVSGIEG